MIRPLGLIHGHYECRSLNETVPVFIDLLALEVVEKGHRQVIVKHPNTDWHLVVHEAGSDAADKLVMNHYGVRVSSPEEVDRAWRYLSEHKDQYRLGKITKLRETHLAYSLYFKHPATPWYVVVVPVKNRRYLNSNSRFILELGSPDAVDKAHRNFAKAGKEIGVTEFGELKRAGANVSFFLSDPDRNWWEITAKASRDAH